MREKKRYNESYFGYAETVRTAKLDIKAKALLWFYANTFNWTKGNPSFYTQDQICAYVGFSPSTYQKLKRYLIDLGWIQTSKASYDSPVFVTPSLGKDDENYELRSWAKGHKSNKKTLEEEIESLPPELRDPFYLRIENEKQILTENRTEK
jgi:hypothetical protein